MVSMNKNISIVFIHTSLLPLLKPSFFHTSSLISLLSSDSIFFENFTNFISLGASPTYKSISQFTFAPYNISFVILPLFILSKCLHHHKIYFLYLSLYKLLFKDSLPFNTTSLLTLPKTFTLHISLVTIIFQLH